MTEHDDLEVSIHSAARAWKYEVELRFQAAGKATDSLSQRCRTTLDLEELLLIDDSDELGSSLAAALFSEEQARTVLAQALAAAAAADHDLRLRLFITSSATELHALRWETLRHPVSGTLLATSEHVLFSRYIASVDFRSLRLRPKNRLRALVVVANPADVAKYRLAPVDVAEEVARARAGLSGITVEVLASGNAGSPVTLKAIVHAAREQDIVYLVCHGKLDAGEPKLYLEGDDGNVAVVLGADFAARFAGFAEPPRLVFLASCQSAGTGGEPHATDAGALSALGPRLSAAGVPAVIGMLGNVTLKTVSEFAKVFFEKLVASGEVDLAAANARGAVRDRPTADAWMPVLFSRLKNGRIWVDQGFAAGGDKSGFDKWEGLLSNLAVCTPILGPTIGDDLLGSRRALARRWAEKYDFPLSKRRAEDLTEVSQYLAIAQSPAFPQALLRKHLVHELAALEAANAPMTEPLATLAELPFSIYLTASADDLLERALRAAGKTPVVDYCRWNAGLRARPSSLADEPKYKPTRDRPLVFHLFGIHDSEASIVASEDDYLDCLVEIVSDDDKEALPELVQEALTDRGLLLLGFPITDWSFRIVLRILRSFRKARTRYVRAAVQIDPDESPLDPEGARRYVDEYLQQDGIDMYWGPALDFVRELIELRQRSGGRK